MKLVVYPQHDVRIVRRDIAGELDEHKGRGLRLARWAHQLGYSGWFSTRSRRYSVTLSSRRDERRDTQAA